MISFFLAILVPILSLSFVQSGEVPVSDLETSRMLRKAGGFMTGVCHANPDYTAIRNANIGWVREDVPFPYDEDGRLSRSYLYWKERMQPYVKEGIRILAITPNPSEYLENGLDVRNADDVPRIQSIARFYAKDLKGIAGAFQIANEMGVDRFTLPFTIADAAKFIGVQLTAMRAVSDDVPIGYNLGGAGLYKLPFRMLRYNAYADYVGLDLYFGSFENIIKSIDAYPAIMRLFHIVTGKPILLTEFGYIGCGEPKTAEEKRAILEEYGFGSEEEAAQDIDAFISRLPGPFRREIEKYYGDLSSEEKAQLLFQGEYANHLYRELPEGFELEGYPHTPQGQAAFFADLIPRLRALRFCAGAFVYMWHDSDRCYVCGQPDCPVETGWGLIDGEGRPKDAYYAVKETFGKIRDS